MEKSRSKQGIQFYLPYQTTRQKTVINTQARLPVTKVLIYVSKRPDSATGAPKEAKEWTEWQIQGARPCKLRPMDAPCDSYSDPTVILSQFSSPLVNPTFVHVAAFMQTRLLGPGTAGQMVPLLSHGFGDWH